LVDGVDDPVPLSKAAALLAHASITSVWEVWKVERFGVA
jgi:hypothetical protein